ncbi:hypothetical protein [Streptomyces sp. CNQ085]|uniref:hypothetical protein n=1 Tax=Streptomyces sp. CNQ085 TaxID=2886944 RepID=UPI001F50A4F8|nr:hypothetical protein [Streptomyces sp. CNQ085]MCI0386196.1 hypothetical protein [Streptomyces sp. CNQ085]
MTAQTTLFDTTTPDSTPTPAPVVPALPAGPADPAAPLVIGLDLSLTSTGTAGEGWADRIYVGDRFRGDIRMDWLEQQVISYIRHADMVAMEGPSYGHGAMAGHEELAWLRCAIRLYCHRQHIPYAVIPPSSLKLYVAGHGKATKGEIRSAVADRYGIHTEGGGRYDMADAYGVFAAARDWLGFPLAEVPERQRRALDGCQWPDRDTVVTRR